MRIVLLGDRHLARIQRELPRIGENVVNAAVGGATVLDLEAQADGVSLRSADAVVISVGTNEAAPWNAIPVHDFQRALTRFMTSHRVRTRVMVAPPGVHEARLGSGDRAAASSVAESCHARLLDPQPLFAPLGTQAFASDGLHLSLDPPTGGEGAAPDW